MFKKLIKFYNCFVRGRCPMCNSNAPKIDNCEICNSYRSSFDGMASEITRAEWWYKYVKVVSFWKRIQKATGYKH